MPRYSILITVIMALLVTLGTISFTVWEFYRLSKQQYYTSIYTKSELIRQIYADVLDRENTFLVLEKNLAIYDLYITDDAEIKEKVMEEGDIIIHDEFASLQELIGSKAVSYEPLHEQIRSEMGMVVYAEHIYFYLRSTQVDLLVKARELQPYKMGDLLYAYLTIIWIVLFAFSYIIRRFYPLRKLIEKIKRFAEGDLNVSFHVEGKDEISEVANEFNHAAQKINALIESRNLFLRNIMHELKTPITKGRFSVEMIENSKHKERLLNVFVRMEGLINEMALVEQITSGFEQSEVEEYRVVDLIDEAIDMGFFDSEHYTLDISSDLMVTANFKIFATAIKNLIDNAIKYADDKKVIITATEQSIMFENYSKKLDEPLSYYLEPFTKSHQAKHSFGLGLYIVNAIVQSHGFSFNYEHLNGWNRFWIGLT